MRRPIWDVSQNLSQEKEVFVDELIRAKIHLIQEHPFWGHIMIGTKMIRMDRIGTCATDGKNMYYNEEFIKKLSHNERVYILGHEAAHILLSHHLRTTLRMMETQQSLAQANIAADLAIAYILEKYKIGQEVDFAKLGTKGIHPDNIIDIMNLIGKQLTPEVMKRIETCCNDISFEEWYNIVEYKTNQPSGGGNGDKQNQSCENGQDGQGSNSEEGNDDQDQGQGKGDNEKDGGLPGKTDQENSEIFGLGGIIAPNQIKDTDEIEQEARIVQAFNYAKKEGRMPADLEREVLKILKPKQATTDDLLRDWLSEKTKDDYSYASPSPLSWCYEDSTMIIPGEDGERLGYIVIAIDTSGSISEDELNNFCEKINCLKSQYNFRCTVVYCDTQIYNPKEFQAEEDIVFNPRGGGGTRFTPVFEYVEDHLLEKNIVGLVYFTDLECNDYPGYEPQYPVLWLAWKGVSDHHKPPFGKIVIFE